MVRLFFGSEPPQFECIIARENDAMSTPLKFWFNSDATLAIPGAFIATHDLKSSDTVLREKLLDYVATPPLANIILNYVAPALPVRNFGDAPFDRLECPGPSFRLENARTVVTERDALVCAEIARLLTIQESMAADTSIMVRAQPHVIGVETSWALDVPKMLIADHNGAMISGLIIRPMIKKNTGLGLIPSWGDVIRVGTLVANHCHPHGIIMRDFSPSRIVCYGEGGDMKTSFMVLSQPYIQHANATDEFTKHYLAWEVVLKDDPECETAITTASDVYAFGLLLFSTIARWTVPWPFCSADVMDKIAKVLSKTGADEVPLSPFGGIGLIDPTQAPLCLLADRCLSPRPEDRPTMDYVLQKLFAFHVGVDGDPQAEVLWVERHKKLKDRWHEFWEVAACKIEENRPQASSTR